MGMRTGKNGCRKRLACCLLALVMISATIMPSAMALDEAKGAESGGATAQGTPPPAGDPNADGEIEMLAKSMKENPTDSVAIRLGHILLSKGVLDKAIAAFDEALRLNPRAFEARVGKGVALGRQGELDKAEQLLREALVLNPNPVRVHYELGLIFEKRGEFDKSVAEFKEGLKLHKEGKR